MLPRASLAALVAASVVCAGACGASPNPPERAAAPADAARANAVASQIAPDLPALPADLQTAARPPEVTRAAYEFAARHPEVLQYVPCFCGCERGGHKANADCFVASRDAHGRVTEWAMHGFACEICIDVAAEAKQRHDAGESVADIRSAIDREYGAAGSHTPTPMPPKGAAGR